MTTDESSTIASGPTAPPTPFGPPPAYDAECGALLRRLPEFPPVTLERIAADRGELADFMPQLTNVELARSGEYVVEERTVPGPEGAPAVPIVICRPSSTAAAVPALLYIHGGGMFGGTARDGLGSVLDLAGSVRAAVISVQYRLAPETPHPGPVEDCFAALAWITTNSAELGIDPTRIVVVGGSAGGGLAAAAALLARDRRAPALAGALLMCPMLDDRNDTPSVLQMAPTRMWNRAANEVGWTALLGAARGGPDVSPYAAPARATDLSGLPPTFIDVGSADSFRDEDVDYANRIWLAGGVAELHVWPGGYHGFDGIAPHAALSKSAVAARIDWLRRLFAMTPEEVR